jgi:hypothetical protein
MIKKIFKLAMEHPAFFGLCLVAGAEACMNAAFGWLSAEGQIWQFAAVFACLYAGAEMAKWKAAEIVGEAYSVGDKPRAAAATLMLVCCLMISLPAHIGFIGMMRDASIQGRDTSKETRTNAKSELEAARTELKAIKTTRTPAEVVLERDRAKEGSSRWSRLEAERLEAERKAKLVAQLSSLETKLGNNNVGMSDARVAVMKWVWPEASDDNLQLMLSVIVAICIEAITAFGFIAVGSQGRERLDLETLLTSGAVAHPGAQDILPFRGEVIEAAKADSTGVDDVFSAYERWCRDAGRAPMARAAFLRLFEALGVRRAGGRFLGVRVRPAFLLRAQA